MGRGMRAGKRSGSRGKKDTMQAQMAQLQAVQAQMERAQAEIEEMETEATAGGGAVTVRVNGRNEIVSLSIQAEVCDPDDVEMLEDLILVATNEAFRQMQEISQNEMNKVTGGLGLPAGLL